MVHDMMPRPRSILAPNASAMTMDGTITYVVGRRRAVVIDPGSRDPSHIESIANALDGAESVRILLTHDHPDHSTGAREVARRVDGRVYSMATGTLRDGGVIDTDEGELIALATPGHAPDHMAFHWPAASAAFCGDLMMGGLDTSVVAAPEGDIGLYLESLDRLASLGLETIYPAHGPAFTDPAAALGRYVRHRQEREEQVRAAVAAGASDIADITDTVYGPDLDSGLRSFAEAAVKAYLQHLLATGRYPSPDDE